MYKISFFVPEDHLDAVKNAMFEAGAGKIGNYSCCAWQVLGTGQFMPLEGSDAFIGEKNRVQTVSEYKVEMVCEDNLLKSVISALRNAHPYEEPAFDVIQLFNIES